MPIAGKHTGTMAQPTGYTGRFAPSPTGPLHLGSLAAALASWVDARAHNGTWLLRIEDIDPEREQPGAAEQIVRSLRSHGLNWDGPIICQSERSARYEAALDSLRKQNRLYACTCTRRALRSIASESGSRAYPGLCRNRHLPEGSSALRFAVIRNQQVSFTDATYGDIDESVADTIGDFIVRRRGPLYAYQLAVVVDDAQQEITHVVRGADLLDNTARQIALQQALGFPQPEYMHVPLITDGAQKLSKQSGAEALNDETPLANLRTAWNALGQKYPEELDGSKVSDFLSFAVSNWKRNRIGTDSINIQNNKMVDTNG